MWATLIPTIISGITSVFSGVFSIKQAKIDSINKAVEVINSSNLSGSERDKAIAAVIASETTSGYWLSAIWRPMLMVILVGIVVAYAFGWTTPQLLKPMPSSSMLSELFELLKMGVMGYMPLRTVDKIVESFTRNNLAKILLEQLSNK